MLVSDTEHQVGFVDFVAIRLINSGTQCCIESKNTDKFHSLSLLVI